MIDMKKAALTLLLAVPLGVCAATTQQPGKTQSAASDKGSSQGAGTTIVGSQESPIGLVIAPWKNDLAPQQAVALKRHLEEAPVPIDPNVFHRRIEYYDSITAFRQAKMSKEASHAP